MGDLAEKLRRAAQHGYAANPGDHSDLLREAAAALEAAREDAEFFRWLAVPPNLYTVCDLLRAGQYVTLRRACESLAAIDQARGIVPEAGQEVGK